MADRHGLPLRVQGPSEYNDGLGRAGAANGDVDGSIGLNFQPFQVKGKVLNSPTSRIQIGHGRSIRQLRTTRPPGRPKKALSRCTASRSNPRCAGSSIGATFHPSAVATRRQELSPAA